MCKSHFEMGSPKTGMIGMAARARGSFRVMPVLSLGNTWMSSSCSEHPGPGSPRAERGLHQSGGLLFLPFLRPRGLSVELPIVILFGSWRFISTQQTFVLVIGSVQARW